MKPFDVIARRVGSPLLLALACLIAAGASAQSPRDAHHLEPLPTAGILPKTSATKPPPPAKPVTDWDRATALARKHAYDQACPLFEKLARATPQNSSLWNDWAQCEGRRGRKKVAVDAAQVAVVTGDRAQRRVSYQTLQSVGNKEEMPEKGCEWLEESPGMCEEQMWVCSYPWQQVGSAARKSTGHALTFGVTDDERDMLEQALRDNSALREQLAAEWKALSVDRAEEVVCADCHARAPESADGLINARAATCFQQKTGRAAPAEVCSQQDGDCDTFNACLDEAAVLAHRSEGAGRSAWPEASDVVAAAHKVCDATCGVVTKVHCDVLAFDACRGLVGYACVTRERGKRSQVTLGELSLNDARGNWSERLPPAEAPPPRPPSGATADSSAKHASSPESVPHPEAHATPRP
jgi:hypothetical protein